MTPVTDHYFQSHNSIDFPTNKNPLAAYRDWLELNDLRTDRFIPVEYANGHKKPRESGWQNRENQSEYWAIDGPKGIVTGDGLVVIDIDLPDEAPNILAGFPGIRVRSMHSGEHIHAAIDGELPDSRSPEWGDIQASGDMVVAPGTTLDHSGCRGDCERAGADTYELIDAAEGSVEIEDFPEIFAGDDVADDSVPEINPEEIESYFDGTRNGRLAYARNRDEKLERLFLWACGKRSLAGFPYSDRSSAECALAQKLLWWFQWHVPTVRDVLDTIRPPKWSQRGEDYRASVIRAGLAYTAGIGAKYERGRESGVCRRHALDVCVVLGIADGPIKTSAIVAHEFIGVETDQVRKVLNHLKADGFVRYERAGRSGHWITDELPDSEHRFFDRFPTEADIDRQRRRWAVSE